MNIFASIALIKGISKPHQADPEPPDHIWTLATGIWDNATYWKNTAIVKNTP